MVYTLIHFIFLLWIGISFERISIYLMRRKDRGIISTLGCYAQDISNEPHKEQRSYHLRKYVNHTLPKIQKTSNQSSQNAELIKSPVSSTREITEKPTLIVVELVRQKPSLNKKHINKLEGGIQSKTSKNISKGDNKSSRGQLNQTQSNREQFDEVITDQQKQSTPTESKENRMSEENSNTKSSNRRYEPFIDNKTVEQLGRTNISEFNEFNRAAQWLSKHQELEDFLSYPTALKLMAFWWSASYKKYLAPQHTESYGKSNNGSNSKNNFKNANSKNFLVEEENQDKQIDNPFSPYTSEFEIDRTKSSQLSSSFYDQIMLTENSQIVSEHKSSKILNQTGYEHFKNNNHDPSQTKGHKHSTVYGKNGTMAITNDDNFKSKDQEDKEQKGKSNPPYGNAPNIMQKLKVSKQHSQKKASSKNETETVNNRGWWDWRPWFGSNTTATLLRRFSTSIGSPQLQGYVDCSPLDRDCQQEITDDENKFYTIQSVLSSDFPLMQLSRGNDSSEVIPKNASSNPEIEDTEIASNLLNHLKRTQHPPHARSRNRNETADGGNQKSAIRQKKVNMINYESSGSTETTASNTRNNSYDDSESDSGPVPDESNSKYLATHTATLMLENVADVQYFGTVGFGTPPQALHLVFDTGSADLWVASPECSQCDTPQRYNKTKSSTCVGVLNNGKVSLEYGKGTVSGTVVGDTITVGTLEIPNQKFLLVTDEQSLEGAYFDGVLGLAFSSIAHAGESVLNRLVQLKKIASPTFAFVLSNKENKNSKLVIGDLRFQKRNLMSFWWVPIRNPQWWMLQTEVLTGSQLTGKFSVSAILDTGTSFIAIPENQYGQFINALIPPTAKKFCWIDSRSNLIQCPCTATTYFNPVHFKFSSTGFSLPLSFTNRTKSMSMVPEAIIFQPEHLVTKVPGSPMELSSQAPSQFSQSSITPEAVTHPSYSKPDISGSRNPMSELCSVDIIPCSNSLPWILGDTFLRQVDAVFDATPQNPIVGLRMRNVNTPLLSQLYSIDGAVPVQKEPPTTEIPRNTDTEATEMLPPETIEDHFMPLISNKNGLKDVEDTNQYPDLSGDTKTTSDNNLQYEDIIIGDFNDSTFTNNISSWICLLVILSATIFVLLWTCGCFKRVFTEGDIRFIQLIRAQSSRVFGGLPLINGMTRDHHPLLSSHLIQEDPQPSDFNYQELREDTVSGNTLVNVS